MQTALEVLTAEAGGVVVEEEAEAPPVVWVEIAGVCVLGALRGG